MILIGSQAAKFHQLNFKRKVDENEYDLIGSRNEYEKIKANLVVYSEKESTSFPGHFNLRGLFKDQEVKIEFDATKNLSNEILQDLVELHKTKYGLHPDLDELTKTTTVCGMPALVPNKFLLYEIKRSHANFAIHFDKTFHDVLEMQRQGWNVNPNSHSSMYQKFYETRHLEAKNIYGKFQERIKLNKTNEEFFKGGADLRIYEHDDLHKAIAYFPDYPMFVRSKRDPNSAKLEKELFFKLDKQFQIYTAMEEAMVLSLERIYIPATEKQGIQISEEKIPLIYKNGLKKVVSVSKNWFQDFVLDNLTELEKPQWDYISRFKEAKKNQKIALVK